MKKTNTARILDKYKIDENNLNVLHVEFKRIIF